MVIFNGAIFSDKPNGGFLSQGDPQNSKPWVSILSHGLTLGGLGVPWLRKPLFGFVQKIWHPSKKVKHHHILLMKLVTLIL
jgi:hypothetical protein